MHTFLTLPPGSVLADVGAARGDGQCDKKQICKRFGSLVFLLSKQHPVAQAP